MSAKVSSVIEGSIAEEIGIEPGDEIVKINDTVLKDYIDYKFIMASEEIDVEVKKQDGESEIIEIEKDFDEDLGIVFESAIFDKIKPCTNHCIFCFVDQQPDGLRDSLYVKDDDYRLSYLQGTYVTLTNLTDKDRDRIKSLHLGPLYVSVHSTNPELRTKMLRNPRAAQIMDELKWLKKYDIPIHAQIVLCPGFNDGVELERTLNDLSKFKSILGSIAVVPVGVTKFRKEKLQTIDKDIANTTIELIDAFNKKVRKHLACASDEFFLVAERPVPASKYYGSFSQLEDGVGALRLLMDDFKKNKSLIPKKLEQETKVTFVASYSVYKMLLEFSETFNKVKNLKVDVLPVKSDFLGEKINVAGLICANDIIEQLKDKELKNVIIPSIMLRPYSREFLDGLSIADVERELNCKIRVIEDIYSGKDLIEKVIL